jgi:hypothetical protein
MESGSASADSPMEARIARIESDVAHLKTDVADVKVDLRAVRDKMDEMDVRLNGKMDETDVRLSRKMDTGFARINARLDGLKDEISSAKTWGVMLYVPLAGMMLSVMARGFGWI